MPRRKMRNRLRASVPLSWSLSVARESHRGHVCRTVPMAAFRCRLLAAPACAAGVCIGLACTATGRGSSSLDGGSDGASESETDAGADVEGVPAVQDAMPDLLEGPYSDAEAAVLDWEDGMEAAPAIPEAGCPRDLPSSCELPAPSWMNVVQPIIVQRCNDCHGGGGVEQAAFDFSTYQGVRKAFGSVLNNVYGCQMPPPDAGALTSEQRQALLAWLVCAAPNN